MSLFIIAVTIADEYANILYSIENSDGISVSSIGAFRIVDEQGQMLEIDSATTLISTPGLTVGNIAFRTTSVGSDTMLNIEVDSFRANSNAEGIEIPGTWIVKFLQHNADSLEETGVWKLVRSISADIAPVESLNNRHPGILSFDVDAWSGELSQREYFQITDGRGILRITREEFEQLASSS
jgi:hypothetical protein